MRVLDLANVLAGPFCCYQLVQLGAEVIKVETPGTGDLARQLGADPELNRRLMGASFLAQNAGKRSLGLDLKHPAGRAVFERLAGRADVLVENFRPGVLDRLGIGAEALLKANPRLVYCAISGFGREGPLRDRPAYDHVIQAVSGMMAVTGTVASGPMRVGFPLTDYVAGLLAAFAVATALFRRERSGIGGIVDVAMLDAALVILGPVLAQFLIGGQVPPPAGNQPFGGSPFSGIFATADGLLAVVGSTAKQCLGLCRVLGLAALEADARILRWQAHPELKAEIAPLLERAYLTRTAEDWELRMAAADIPAGKVRGVGEILGHPHLAERALLAEISDVPGVGRTIKVPDVGFKLFGAERPPLRPPPLPFADTREVLRANGWSDREIDALERDGAVACAPS